MKPPKPILAVMLHVSDWSSATDWYQRAFPESLRIPVASNNFGRLDYQGISIEIVPADNKVTAGAAGSIVYWAVENFEATLQNLLSIGGRLYRGPIAIEDSLQMCQVIDPWGNCIGLRGCAERQDKDLN
jgi:predicted enzyme related to lactoylglutathione lyase